jgi:hypothetical protein
MIRQYKFRQLMTMLTSDKWFVLKGNGERYFFAQIVD